MQYFDVYNDGGFVMRSTLPMITIVFGLHRLAVERILRDAKEGKQTDLHINRSATFHGCFTVFAATTALEPNSQDIFA